MRRRREGPEKISAQLGSTPRLLGSSVPKRSDATPPTNIYPSPNLHLKDYASPPADPHSKASLELLALFEEMEKEVADINKKIVAPLHKKLEEGALDTKNGLALLETQLQLLLSYLSQIAFYILMKASGQSIAGHPLIERLIYCRVLIEKMRPLEKKFKYQIDKLLDRAKRTLSSGAAVRPDNDNNNNDNNDNSAISRESSGQVENGPARPDGSETQEKGKEGGEGEVDSEDDLLKFGPRPNALGNVGKEVGRPEAAAEEGEQPAAPAPAPALYVPPKVKPVTLDTQQAKLEQQAARMKKAMKQKANVRDLRNDFLNLPEEVTTYGSGSVYRPSAEEIERTKYEEEHFVRLQETKAMKKNRKAAQSLESMEDLDTFDDGLAFLSGGSGGGKRKRAVGSGKGKSKKDKKKKKKRAGKKKSKRN
eukprot:g82171.t1